MTLRLAQSYARTAHANETGVLAKEIVPVAVKQRRGDPKASLISGDETGGRNEDLQ